MKRIKAGIAWLSMAVFVLTSCSGATRGIADKRTDFQQFLPMSEDPGRHGLREVKPRFKNGSRSQLLRVLDETCRGGKEGSSSYDPQTKEGYYVNCNPQNRQILNGYIPSTSSKKPHSN